jgi:polar amino acid transport system permease protein
MGLAKLSKNLFLKVPAIVFVEFFRGSSALVQLFWAFYVLPFFGLIIPAIVAAILVLGFNVGSFASEIVRGSIQAIPPEQREACVALNLSKWQAFRYVILPQALRMMLPPFSNQANRSCKPYHSGRCHLSGRPYPFIDRVYASAICIDYGILLLVIKCLGVWHTSDGTETSASDRGVTAMPLWDWNYALECIPQLLEGIKITLLATFLGSLLAMFLGLIFAIAKRSHMRLISVPVIYATDFIRSTPLLVQLYILFFVLPNFGIVLSPLVAGIVGLGVHYACYTAEVYRAGIESIPKGQWEAAKACNFTYRQTWTKVIIPQAIPSLTYRYIEPYTLVGVFFLLISIPAALAVTALEHHIQKNRA